ncbi:GerAB/ArcD/ProY family transporter, partial [Pseudomonas sp. 2995-1]|uniref:GerAB/ArcD/ProY family transporter n=1 Tax=Pseudomonas sp. 2995-1 TaxID=1712679 RepID=UPI00130445FC
IRCFRHCYFEHLILLGSLSYFELRHFFPVWRNGFVNAILATEHHNADWAMAIMMVAMILPMVKGQEKWTITSIRATIYGGLFIVLWPVLKVGVLSPEVAGQY